MGHYTLKICGGSAKFQTNKAPSLFGNPRTEHQPSANPLADYRESQQENGPKLQSCARTTTDETSISKLRRVWICISQHTHKYTCKQTHKDWDTLYRITHKHKHRHTLFSRPPLHRHWNAHSLSEERCWRSFTKMFYVRRINESNGVLPLCA